MICAKKIKLREKKERKKKEILLSLSSWWSFCLWHRPRSRKSRNCSNRDLNANFTAAYDCNQSNLLFLRLFNQMQMGWIITTQWLPVRIKGYYMQISGTDYVFNKCTSFLYKETNSLFYPPYPPFIPLAYEGHQDSNGILAGPDQTHLYQLLLLKVNTRIKRGSRTNSLKGLKQRCCQLITS